MLRQGLFFNGRFLRGDKGFASRGASGFLIPGEEKVVDWFQGRDGAADYEAEQFSSTVLRYLQHFTEDWGMKGDLTLSMRIDQM